MSQTYVPLALVRAVTERASGQCEYCRCLTGFSSDPFAVEHIIPEARGGADVLLFHPREQRWAAHFAWTPDTTELIGMTATGRATVVRLRLNRLGLVNLRAALRHFGVHPPEDI